MKGFGIAGKNDGLLIFKKQAPDSPGVEADRPIKPESRKRSERGLGWQVHSPMGAAQE